MKILLVDDDLELGTMLSEYLIGEGFDASLVLTGGRASTARCPANSGGHPRYYAARYERDGRAASGAAKQPHSDHYADRERGQYRSGNWHGDGR